MPEEVVDTAQRTVRLYTLPNAHQFSLKYPAKLICHHWINKLSNLEIGGFGEWRGWRGEDRELFLSLPPAWRLNGRKTLQCPSLRSIWDGDPLLSRPDYEG